MPLHSYHAEIKEQMSNFHYEEKPWGEDKQWKMQPRNSLSTHSSKNKKQTNNGAKTKQGSWWNGMGQNQQESSHAAGVSKAAPAHPSSRHNLCFR